MSAANLSPHHLEQKCSCDIREHSPVRRETGTRTKGLRGNQVSRLPRAFSLCVFRLHASFCVTDRRRLVTRVCRRGRNAIKQRVNTKKYINLLRKASGRGPSHCQSRWERLLSSQSDCAGESLTFHMTFCHFASDILNMLSLTFVSGRVCRLQNKSRDAAGNTKGVNKRTVARPR